MPALSKVIIYAKDVDKLARFYGTHFGFKQLPMLTNESSNWCPLMVVQIF
jgi:hypothetical protein